MTTNDEDTHHTLEMKVYEDGIYAGGFELSGMKLELNHVSYALGRLLAQSAATLHGVTLKWVTKEGVREVQMIPPPSIEGEA